jgi:hypothetical protein
MLARHRVRLFAAAVVGLLAAGGATPFVAGANATTGSPGPYCVEPVIQGRPSHICTMWVNPQPELDFISGLIPPPPA